MPFFVVWAIFVVLAIGGWIANIVKLVANIGNFDMLEVMRCIGVIAAPLGAVLGFV